MLESTIERERESLDCSTHDSPAARFVSRNYSLLDNNDSNAIRRQHPSRGRSGWTAADDCNIVFVVRISPHINEVPHKRCEFKQKIITIVLKSNKIDQTDM